ncbi:MAG: hypothetical protein COA69_02860 [Robiginitomaculum sp.]|nr:MAG: hypothetical protein COA69_02860 [Robiginitomaculum sp.]
MTSTETEHTPDNHEQQTTFVEPKTFVQKVKSKRIYVYASTAVHKVPILRDTIHKIINKIKARPMAQKTTPEGQYQSVVGKDGSSNSQGKWDAMKVPANEIEGARVLDLGCNEGFFIEKFMSLGASAATGVDKDTILLDRARKRVPGANFVDAFWDDFLGAQADNSFDLIIMLSAIHYAPNYHQILRKINRVLAPGGTFYLEGSVGGFLTNLLVPVDRGQGAGADTVYHFTHASFARILSDQFTLRYINRSVDQPGDPIPRHMYKLTPKLRTCLIVTGASASGKTTLSQRIELADFTHIEIDKLTKMLMQTKLTGLGRDMAEKFSPRQLNKVYEYLLEDQTRLDQFTKYLIRNCKDTKDIVMEGVILNDDAYRARIIGLLEDDGFFVRTIV